MNLIDCHNHIGVELTHYLHGDFPYAQHLSVMVNEGRELGVRRWVVFPMVGHLAMSLEAMLEGKVESGGLQDVPYAYENRRMMSEIYELFPDEGASTLPLAMFDAIRNPEGQVKELRRLRDEYSFYGLKTQPTITQAPIKSLLEGNRAILEFAAEFELPFLIHSSVLPADIWSQARDILDIAEQYPGTRFCVAHSLRFDKEQLDRLNDLPNCWFDCSAHRIHCELAVQDSPVVAPAERRFDSDYNRPAQVLRDLAETYPNKMMWGSDSPFYSFVAVSQGERVSLLSSYAQEVAALRALPLHLQQEIGETNTLNFLKLDQ